MSINVHIEYTSLKSIERSKNVKGLKKKKKKAIFTSINISNVNKSICFLFFSAPNHISFVQFLPNVPHFTL